MCPVSTGGRRAGARLTLSGSVPSQNSSASVVRSARSHSCPTASTRAVYFVGSPCLRIITCAWNAQGRAGHAQGRRTLAHTRPHARVPQGLGDQHTMHACGVRVLGSPGSRGNLVSNAVRVREDPPSLDDEPAPGALPLLFRLPRHEPAVESPSVNLRQSVQRSGRGGSLPLVIRPGDAARGGASRLSHAPVWRRRDREHFDHRVETRAQGRGVLHPVHAWRNPAPRHPPSPPPPCEQRACAFRPPTPRGRSPRMGA